MPTLTPPRIGKDLGVGQSCPLCPCTHGEKVICARCDRVVCRLCSVAFFDGTELVRVCRTRRCLRIHQ